MIGEVVEVIKEVALEGMTMIAVTDEMGFAKECTDRIVMMDDGVVLDDAPPTNLF